MDSNQRSEHDLKRAYEEAANRVGEKNKTKGYYGLKPWHPNERFKSQRFSRRRRGFFKRHSKPLPVRPRCPICEGEILELASAIHFSDTNSPAHFDCIIKRIEKSEELAPNEKVCYLGKGSFGIVRMQKLSLGGIPFIIRKRIQFENLDTIPDWRKKLDQLAGKN